MQRGTVWRVEVTRKVLARGGKSYGASLARCASEVWRETAWNVSAAWLGKAWDVDLVWWSLGRCVGGEWRKKAGIVGTAWSVQDCQVGMMRSGSSVKLSESPSASRSSMTGAHFWQ